MLAYTDMICNNYEKYHQNICTPIIVHNANNNFSSLGIVQNSNYDSNNLPLTTENPYINNRSNISTEDRIGILQASFTQPSLVLCSGLDIIVNGIKINDYIKRELPVVDYWISNYINIGTYTDADFNNHYNNPIRDYVCVIGFGESLTDNEMIIYSQLINNLKNLY